MTRFSLYWKAIVGFIAPGLVALGVAITAGSDGGASITTAEWVGIVIAMFVTGGAVYASPPNAIPADRDLHD